MLGNRKTFESYLRNTETLDRDFDTYIKKMTVNKVWGGLAEVHAAALLLHFNYAIYLPDKNVPFVKQTPFPNEITIYLQFKNGNHFNSLMLPDKKIKIQLKKKQEDDVDYFSEYEKRLKLRIKPVKTDFENTIQEVEFQSSQEGRNILNLFYQFNKIGQKTIDKNAENLSQSKNLKEIPVEIEENYSNK